MRQYTLSFKVTGEEKQAFAQRCASAGKTQSEMLEQLVLGRVPDEQPLIGVARAHISLIHDLRAGAAAGRLIDAARMNELLTSTRELIAAVRHSLDP
ncbi:hypothetical protein DAH66_17420 [Sphingomonas koreensis]|uniref:Mobilization protein n=2 Tax=Sphingomonas koreensis TaxID=93064 RepID=A0A430G087_9SPHN|nr:hypothetical protein DAH66_17420 [Sphingomonas koreensis]